MQSHYDAIVIGAGQAGPSLTARLTQRGLTVALIERAEFGGTCVNTGCTPTKTLIASARIAYQAREAGRFGIHIATDQVSVDFPAVRARKDLVVLESRTGLETWLQGMKGCTLYRGHARFESAHQVRVGDATIRADKIFINVGGRPRTPNLSGLAAIDHHDSDSMLALETLPNHLIIVGGSYIGLEFAQLFRRFGSQVTVIEMQPRLLPHEDPEISDAVRSIFEAEQIGIRTSAECIGFERQENSIAANVSCQSGNPAVIGSHVLLAVGREPNTNDLGLDRAGIAVDERGYIAVDDALETNVPGVWALGDCNGKGAFTHTAFNDFQIVAENLLDGATRRVSDRIPCYALYTDPPLGRVGLSETQARQQGHEVLIGIRPMTRVSRAVEKGETLGLLKIVVDKSTDLILGAAIYGVGGDEAIHAVIDAMAAGMQADTLRQTMHIHPTVAELLPTILGELA